MDEPRPSPAPGEAGPGTVEPGESRPGSAGERMAGPRTPGEQRPAGSPSTTLVRRPSERYADASAPTAGQPDSERQDPLPRAVGLTFIAGVVIAVLGNFGIVTGLIVAAATAAWLIATVVRGAD